MDAYAAEMERAKRFVLDRGLVGVPDGALEVVATPDFMAPLIPFAAYDPPGAFAEARTGTFYVTVPREGEPREHCVHELAATALHEGYPGHHLQHLWAQRLDSPVRRVVWSALAVEGWALYCEELMAEQGFYDRPETALFHQVYLLWRAARVVLDVQAPHDGDAVRGGRHLPQRSCSACRGRAPRPRCAATASRRATSSATRSAAGTCCGCARTTAGAPAPRFSLRAFHDELLTYGGLPVALMRWGMGLADGEGVR